MTMRRTTGALMIAALALFVGACSSDSDGDSDAKKDATTTTAADDSATTTEAPLSDEAYSEKTDEIAAAIEGAGTDLCALSTATTEGPPQPTTTAQVEDAVGLYVTLLNAVANSFPAESADKGEALKTSAATLQSEAESAGYPVDFFESEVSATALSGEGYETAMTEYQTLYAAQCATTETTVPEG